jgi:hypothetical protein
MNEGYRWKNKLFSEQGRAQLEKFPSTNYATCVRLKLSSPKRSFDGSDDEWHPVQGMLAAAKRTLRENHKQRHEMPVLELRWSPIRSGQNKSKNPVVRLPDAPGTENG